MQVSGIREGGGRLSIQPQSGKTSAQVSLVEVDTRIEETCTINKRGAALPGCSDAFKTQPKPSWFSSLSARFLFKNTSQPRSTNHRLLHFIISPN